MGLFGRKSSYEKYLDEAEQNRLASERRAAERQQYVEDHAGPWVKRLAAGRGGANRCSPEAYNAAGDPGWPADNSDLQWFITGVERLMRKEEGRARVDARFEDDEEKARPLHDEVEFWMSVWRQFSTEGILRQR